MFNFELVNLRSYQLTARTVRHTITLHIFGNSIDLMFSLQPHQKELEDALAQIELAIQAQIDITLDGLGRFYQPNIEAHFASIANDKGAFRMWLWNAFFRNAQFVQVAYYLNKE